MDQPILSDKNQFPNEEIIYSHIGKTKLHWLSLFSYIRTNHPDVSGEWRYYNDGKSWLYKSTRKSKTIFWLKVIRNSFSTTFYFPDRGKEVILKSSISKKLKDEYLEKLKAGKFHGITIVYKTKKDVVEAKKLIELKLKFK